MTKKLNKKGFTLIEVVLVLAIGGLIFLLAFIAFSQASKNRRDTQRRSDAGKVVSQLESYYSDAKTYPTGSTGSAVSIANTCTTTTAASFAAFVGSYICEDDGSGTKYFKNPGGSNYQLGAATATPAKDVITYYKDRACGDTTTVATNTISVYVGLEKGVICRSNN